MMRDVTGNRSLIKILTVLLLLGLLTPLAAADSTVFDAQAIYRRAVASVATVRVQTNGRSGIGTGFVIDRGIVITAAHVARNAEHIAVEFADTEGLEARVIGYDARRDLAVLRMVDRLALPSLDVADTETVQAGDPVVVIGTPRGVPRVMTTGEVRATSVTFPGLVPRIMIFFDAGVAPGNSGGPLLNASGQVIGVVVAGTSRGSGGGLAVSGSTLRATLPIIGEGARYERPWMGLTGTSLTRDLVRQRRLTVDRGILILEVLPGGPADVAGLRGAVSDGPPGDVIRTINDEPIDDWDELLDFLATREPGQRLRLNIVRGAESFNLSIVLGVRP